MFSDEMRKLSKSVKKAIIGVSFGTALLALIITLSAPPRAEKLITARWTHRLENLFYDAYFQWITAKEIPETQSDKVQYNDNFSNDVIIVDIDENSLTKLGNYNTWTRKIHADVVKSLGDGGASAIAFDILFKNADFGKSKASNTIGILDTLYPDMNWPSQYEALRSRYNDDSLLIDAVHKNGNTIVAGMFSGRNAYRHESQWRPLSTPVWRDSIGTNSTFALSQMSGKGNINAWDLLDNIFPELSHAGAQLGAVNIIPEEDGIVRTAPFIHSFPNTALYPEKEVRLYGSVSLAVLMHIFHRNPADVKIKLGEYVNLGKPFGIYRDSSGTLRTTYPNFSYPMVRALIAYNAEVATRAKDSIAGNFAEIAHLIVAKKNDAGELSIELPNGSTLTGEMLRAAKSIDLGNPQVKAPLNVSPGDTPGTILLQDTASGDECELDQYSIGVLRYSAADLDSLKPGESRHLSCELDVNYSSQKKMWKTNYGILAKDVLEDLAQADLNKIEALPIGGEIRFGHERRIPIDTTGAFRLRYRARFNVAPGLRSFQHISYYDVTKNRLDPGLYQGKIFILGSTAPALFDFYSAPHEEHFPAVLIYATTLQNVLDENYLRVPKESTQLYIIIILAILSFFLGFYCSQKFSPFIQVFLIIGYLLVGMYFFSQNVYLGIARPILVMFFTYVASLIVRIYFESSERRFLNQAFRQYISPELIDEMVNQEIMPTLGGTESEITAYFTDIAHFSTFSESIGNPSKLVELLNEYLSAMTDILLKHRGTLDKYEGDAIIAFFGAPMQLKNQRQSACETALDMQQALVKLRKKWAGEKNKWPREVSHMHMRIGINTGKIVTGNMGSSTRKNYTMMGDSVNLASRLESISKMYGTEVLVSEETINGLENDSILYRSIDAIRVVGKSEAVLTFELMCKADDPESEKMRAFIHLWEEGRRLYIAMQWDAAEDIFKKTKELEPHDPSRDPDHPITPSTIFIARCEAYKKDPPKVTSDGTWDGVYTATSK